jgi:hypothetical protein
MEPVIRDVLHSFLQRLGEGSPRRQCPCLGRAEGETATAARKDNEPHRRINEKLRAPWVLVVEFSVVEILWWRPVLRRGQARFTSNRAGQVANSAHRGHLWRISASTGRIDLSTRAMSGMTNGCEGLEMSVLAEIPKR